MLAGAVRRYLNRYAVRAGPPGGRADQQRQRLSHRARPAARAGAAVTVLDLRPRAEGALARQARGCRDRACWPATRSPRPRAAPGRVGRGPRARATHGDGSEGAGARPSPATWSASPAAGARPSICNRNRARGRATTPRAGCFCPARRSRPSARPAPATARSTLARLPRGGRARRRRSGRGGGLHRRSGRSCRPSRSRPRRPPACSGRCPRARPLRKSKLFVDLQNDVTAADLALALREGYRSIEHVKRYTTTGMGTDQGKTSNVNALGIVAEHHRSADRRARRHHLPPALHAGDRSARSPGATAAPLFDPVRRTPMHAWHEAQGAVFEDVGQWKRPRYYPRAGRGHGRRGRARGRGRADQHRHSRRLDARQDRPPGAATRPSCSTASTPTPGASSRSAAAATA